MSSVITLTFSPCIDKSTAIAALLPEKKLRCTTPVLEPGGGGINVARAITKLGGKATAIFPSGGYTGKHFNHLLETEQIPSIIIETKNETRENIIVFDEAAKCQYRFGMPGTALQQWEWEACVEAVRQHADGGYIVASGSLPPGVPMDIYAQIAVIAREKNAAFILDTSGDALKAALAAGVFLIKPNLGELALLAGKKEIGPADVGQIASKLIADGSVKVIVVSMGAAGAMLVTEDICKTIKPSPVQSRSTVGAGDSMVAGIVFMLQNGADILQAVRYGVACGTAATLNPGTELCRKEDAGRLYLSVSET